MEAVLSEQSVDTASNLPNPAPYFGRFSWLDLPLAILMLIFALPFIIGLVLLTKITSRGPGIYRQTRVGLKGEVFTVYKIRTMANDAESKSGPVWTAGISDPRVTALGKFMRASHLDELPQLFNVLKGEMALIGPRPERPEFTQFLAREIPGYVGRLSVKPGITGLAQIILPADSDVESVRKKLALDLEYVQACTLILDAKIALCTAIKMVGLRSNEAAHWIGVMKHTSFTKNLNGSPIEVEGFSPLKTDCATGNVEKTERRSISLDELVEGNSEKNRVVDAEREVVAVSDDILDDSANEDLVAEPLSEPGRLGEVDDADSGSLGSLST